MRRSLSLSIYTAAVVRWLLVGRRESAVLRFDFWFERGREDAVVCDQENQTMDIKQMVLSLGRREQRDELRWNSDGACWAVVPMWSNIPAIFW